MKRLIWQLLIVAIILLNGCDNTKKINAVSNNKDTENSNIKSSGLTSKNEYIGSNTQSLSDKTIILNKAQKDYQDSYNNYVRCLRELGPQRIETLQALTIYQKNYHIYQRILNSISENSK